MSPPPLFVQKNTIHVILPPQLPLLGHIMAIGVRRGMEQKGRAQGASAGGESRGQAQGVSGMVSGMVNGMMNGMANGRKDHKNNMF